MYAYPATVTDPILDAMASEEKVVKYVDIPLQHASESVLRRMKRPTGRGNLLGMVERIRERVPGRRHPDLVHRRLPGRDGGRLRGAPRASSRPAEFDNVGVFTYSDEEGTTSFDLPGPRADPGEGGSPPAADEPAEADRARRNRARVGERSRCWSRAPTPTRDLLLRAGRPSRLRRSTARSSLNDGTAEPGIFVTCEVTEAHAYDLVARIV